MRQSVCTLAHGRAGHLRNLVLGLVRSETPPSDLVVAVMQDEPYNLPPTPFPVRQILLGTGDIPLAMARNTAANGASGGQLIFLDVDCIPHPELIGDYASHSSAGGVLMGEVGYLPKGSTDAGLDFPLFEQRAVRHSDRPGPPQSGLGTCRDYRCFWSLNFAISAADFRNIGGFDERYVGYGGEDTDFGRMVSTAGLPLWWVRGAKAYHQYHPHHMPPVHHLDSVLRNTQVFADKWGHTTMQHWLRAFYLMGLAEPTSEGWRKLRDPGERELALTRQQEEQPYASSAAVLEQLEAEALAARPAERDASRLPAIAAQ